MGADTGHTFAVRPAIFEDGFGKRHHADAPGGEPLEVLELRDEFTTETFEAAVRERMRPLAGVHSTWFSTVRTVQRIQQNGSKLFVVYDRAPGTRLSTVLAATHASQSPLDVNAALCVVRQLLTAVALLHQKLPTFAHGAISGDRVIITPKARVVVADHVLGSALESLGASHDWYWNELRVPVPSTTPVVFNQRVDVMQIGILALELMLGRALETGEYPDQTAELTARAWTVATDEGRRPLAPELLVWLRRMLQGDGEEPFASAMDAWADLEHLLGSDNGASFAALERLMSEYERTTTAGMPHGAAPLSIVARRDSSRRVAAAQPAPVAVPAVLEAPAPRELHTEVQSHTPLDAETPRESPTPIEVLTPIEEPAPVAAAQPAPDDAPPSEVSLTEGATVEWKPIVADIRDDDTLGTHSPSSRRRIVAVAAALVLLLGAGLFGRSYLIPSAAAEAPGTLVVNTSPDGFQVFIDGKPRGVTPLTVEVTAGAHELKIATEGEPRVIAFTVSPGSTVSHTIEIPRAAPRTGQLTVRSEPPGARVSIDGNPSGTAPLTLAGLSPGQHTVLLESDLGSITEEVVIEPGNTASLVVPMISSQGVPVSGWISVEAPAEVHVRENGQLLGTSQSDRIMVAAGQHELDIVNESLGYRVRRTVTVVPGKVSPVRLDWPKGSMALNAQPWADVWVNGEKVGETPVGSVVVPIGTHDVVFRHPQLGERTVRATVTTGSPARVTVDMRQR